MSQTMVIERDVAMTTRDGPFSWQGEYFQYRSVNVWPRPHQQPHPPVWSTSSTRIRSRPSTSKGISEGLTSRFKPRAA